MCQLGFILDLRVSNSFFRQSVFNQFVQIKSPYFSPPFLPKKSKNIFFLSFQKNPKIFSSFIFHKTPKKKKFFHYFQKTPKIFSFLLPKKKILNPKIFFSHSFLPQKSKNIFFLGFLHKKKANFLKIKNKAVIGVSSPSPLSNYPTRLTLQSCLGVILITQFFCRPVLSQILSLG